MPRNITKWLLIALAVCFFGLLACLPFAARETIGWMEEIREMTPEKKTLVIDSPNKEVRFSSMGVTLSICQSPDKTAYVEVFDEGTVNQCTVTLTTQNGTAILQIYRFSGFPFSLDSKKNERSLALSLSGQQSVVLYIPKDYSLYCDGYADYTISDFSFVNRSDFFTLPETPEEHVDNQFPLESDGLAEDETMG